MRSTRVSSGPEDLSQCRIPGSGLATSNEHPAGRLDISQYEIDVTELRARVRKTMAGLEDVTLEQMMV